MVIDSYKLRFCGGIIPHFADCWYGWGSGRKYDYEPSYVYTSKEVITCGAWSKKYMCISCSRKNGLEW